MVVAPMTIAQPLRSASTSSASTPASRREPVALMQNAASMERMLNVNALLDLLVCLRHRLDASGSHPVVPMNVVRPSKSAEVECAMPSVRSTPTVPAERSASTQSVSRCAILTEIVCRAKYVLTARVSLAVTRRRTVVPAKSAPMATVSAT